MGDDGLEHTKDNDATSIKAPEKCVYSRDFLLGFSKLEHCKIRPAGLDPVLIRDQTQLNVGTPSTSTGFGKHRSERISEGFSDRQWQRPPSLTGRSIRQPDVKKTDFNNIFSRSAPTSGGFMLGGAMAHPKVIEPRDGLLGSGEQNLQRDPLDLKEQLRKNIDEHKGTKADVSKGTQCFIPLTFPQSFSPGSRKDNDMVKGQYGDKSKDGALETSKASGKQESAHEASYDSNNARPEVQNDVMTRARLTELLRSIANEGRARAPHEESSGGARELKETMKESEEGDKIHLLEAVLGKDFINDLYKAAKQASGSNASASASPILSSSSSSSSSPSSSSAALKEENKALLDALQFAQLSKLLNDTALASTAAYSLASSSPYLGDMASAMNAREANAPKIPLLFPGMLSPGHVSPPAAAGLASGRLSPGLPSGHQLSPGLPNLASGRLSPGLPNLASGRLSPGLSPADSPVSPFTFGARRGTGSFMPDYSKQQKGKKHASAASPGLPPTSPNNNTILAPKDQLPAPTAPQDNNNKNADSNKQPGNKAVPPSSPLAPSPWPPNFPFHLLQGNFVTPLAAAAAAAAAASQSPWGLYGVPFGLPLDSPEQAGLNLMQQLQFQALNAKLPFEGWLEACQYLQAPPEPETALAASLTQLQRTRSLDQLLRTRAFA